MRLERLDNMFKGWFVGDFSPTLLKTEAVEVAVKAYKKGDAEEWHYHKIATEVTVVVSGEVRMCGQTFKEGDMIVLEPLEGTDFLAITDAVTAVVKLPGAKNDKYLREED